MKNKNIWIAVVLVVVIGAGWYFSQAGIGASSTKTYTNSQYGFALQYPAGTEVKEDLTGGYPTISFWGDYGVIHVSPTYVSGYRDMGCPEPTSKKATLAGRSVIWRETCGVTAISFEQPPASWKQGSKEASTGNVILVVPLQGHVEEANNIVSTFRFLP